MDWAAILKDEARYSDVILADRLARKYKVRSVSLRIALSRQEARGFVERVKGKVYVNKLANDSSPLDFVNVLRPNAYVSLDSALQHWGISTQYPSALTCVTTGKPNFFTTKSFSISFRSISPKLYWGFVEKSTRYSSYRIAEPEKALLDWIYLSLQEGTAPGLDEFEFQSLSRSKLVRYADRFPSSVLKVLLRHLALKHFAA